MRNLRCSHRQLMLAVALALLLAGCANKNRRPADAKPAAPEVITGGERPEGEKSATVKRGEELVLALWTETGAGYAWRVTDGGEKNIVSIGAPRAQDVPGAATQAAWGGGRWTSFTIRGNKRGKTTLEFVYDRTWEDRPPSKTFTLDVNVTK